MHSRCLLACRIICSMISRSAFTIPTCLEVCACTKGVLELYVSGRKRVELHCMLAMAFVSSFIVGSMASRSSKRRRHFPIQVSNVVGRRTPICSTAGKSGFTTDGRSNSQDVLSQKAHTPEDTSVSLDIAEEHTEQVSEFDEDIVHVYGGDYDLVDGDEANAVGQSDKVRSERERTRKLIQEIDLEPETKFTSDADSLPPIEEDETTAWVETTVRAADTRKATNPVAIRVARLTYITTFLVMVTGNSTPQLRAIANLIEENMYKEHGTFPKRSSGTPNSGWLLMDCKAWFSLCNA